MGASFLQTAAAVALRKAVDEVENVSDDDKEMVLSFLSGKSSYAPKSGEITGILKQMGDSFAADLKAAKEAEATAVNEFEALVAAKKKEIEALTLSIETKLTAVGELGMSIVQMKADFLSSPLLSSFSSQKMRLTKNEGGFRGARGQPARGQADAEGA